MFNRFSIAIGALFLVLSIGACSKNRQLILTGSSPSGSPHLRFESDPANRFITYKGFAVKYDTLHKIPAFTIHRLHPDQLKDSMGIKATRSNRFWVDTERLANQSATDSDYKKSGYDRGHHVPAGDFVYSQSLKDETFVYTNVSPQYAKLNRGIFASLENRIREKVKSCACEAYVITGTIYPEQGGTSIGSGEVGVPSYLYKVAYFPNLNRAYAYAFPNGLEYYGKELFHYQKTVDEIEVLTREDFFDRLEDKIESKLEKKKPTL